MKETMQRTVAQQREAIDDLVESLAMAGDDEALAKIIAVQHRLITAMQIALVQRLQAVQVHA